MSKERARRRAEREAAAAVAAARRAAVAEKEARRRARRERLTGWLPRPASRPAGVLADRRRRQIAATALLLVVLNLLVYAVSRDAGLAALMVVASILGAPIVYLMIFRRT